MSAHGITSTVDEERLSTHFNELLTRAHGLTNSDPQSASTAAREAAMLAKRMGHSADEGRALLALSRAQLAMSCYAELLATAREALRIFDALNDFDGQAYSTMLIGNVYSHLADYSEALRFYDQALELAEASGNAILVTKVRANLSMAEAALGNWQTAIDIAQKNRRSNAENPQPEIQAGLIRCLAYAHVQFGLALVEDGADAEAMPHLDQALTLARQAHAVYVTIGDLRHQRSCLVIMAEALKARREYAQAIDVARQILSGREKIMPRAAVLAQLVLGSATFRTGDHAAAESALLTALAMSEEEGDARAVLTACRTLAELYESLGNPTQALKFSQRAATAQRLLLNEALQRRAHMVEERRQREQTAREVLRQRELLSEKEMQLHHASRLAVAGEMLSIITHEMKQPLAAIMNYSETCLNWLDDDEIDREQFRRALETTCAETSRAGEVIKRLRRFLSQAPAEVSLIDPNEVVGDSIELTRAVLRSHQVKLDTRLARDLPRVIADDILLAQILTNLIRNAVEAMAKMEDRERELVIATRPGADATVLVEVADNGTGIEADTLKKIFDPFFSTKKGDGMGLGLAISRSIAESFGGKLLAANRTNSPHGGAVFTLTLATA